MRRRPPRKAISIHAPAQGATHMRSFAPSTSTFQSTPPRRGRRMRWRRKRTTSTISIHAPAQGATQTGQAKAGERGISIHAPAQGATTVRYFATTGVKISIHAPAQGATLCATRKKPATQHFNPRPRAGGDQFVRLKPVRVRISIHAPAQGATRSIRSSTPTSPHFNPRPRAGGDSHGGRRQAAWPHFNPRPRAGGDVFSAVLGHLTRGFQSTPPRRGRHVSKRDSGRIRAISIHAPAQGATVHGAAY